MKKEIRLISRILQREELTEHFKPFEDFGSEVLSEYRKVIEKETLKAIMDLKEKQKKVIVALYFEEKTFEEIAEKLKVNVEKVVCYESKAISNLAENKVFEDLISVFTGENVPLHVHKYFSVKFNNEMFKVQMKDSVSNMFYEILNYTILTEPISYLNFSNRVLNALNKSDFNIVTIRDLTNITEVELKKIRNLGGVAKEEIITKLAAHGLSIILKQKGA